MLVMAGIERNPGPRNEGNCKGHGLRAKVEQNLAEKINSPYVPNHIRDKKVFKVSVGPKIQELSFKDIEATFVKGKEWANMLTNIWTVPTAIIKKRLKSHETLLDIEKEICKEFENKKEIEKGKLKPKENKQMEENEKNNKILETQIEARAEKELEKNKEFKKKIDFYKNRLGDEAEDRVLEGISAAMAGIPSLVINGIKFFAEFPGALREAGIELESYAANHQREIDILLLFPKDDVLCVRFLEVKRQVKMPYDTAHKPLKKELTNKMMEQMKKNAMEFLRLFPDFSPSRLDIKVLGALPYTSGEEAFCSECLEKTLVQEDFNVSDSGERIRSKLGLPETPSQVQRSPSSDSIEMYKQAAARLLGLHSLVHKNIRDFGSGHRATEEKLNEVVEVVDNDVAILLSEEQRDVLMKPITSTFIWGPFGSGKTVVALWLVQKFIEKIKNANETAVIIVSAFEPNCSKLVDQFRDLFSQTDGSIPTNVTDIMSLKDEFGVNTFRADPVDVLNQLLVKISAKYPDGEILLMMDEVDSWSRGTYPKSFNWTDITIPDPRLTLLTCHQPDGDPSGDSGQEILPPPETEMRAVRLKRQYRSTDAINALLRYLSDNLLDYDFSDFKLLDCPAVSGHDIPGLVPEWYSIAGTGDLNGDDYPDRDDLKAVMDELGEELSDIHSNLDQVNIIYDHVGADVSTVPEDAPQFPHKIAESFLGCESLTVIYIGRANGGGYMRALEGLSRAGVSLYIVVFGQGYLQKILDKAPDHIVIKRVTPSCKETGS